MKILLGSILYFSFIFSAFAIDVIAPSGETPLPDLNTDPTGAIVAFIRFLVLLVGVLAVMVITWGGISFILATGDDEKIKKSRKAIIYAFVGVVVS